MNNKVTCQLEILLMSENRFSEIYGSVNYGLFLFALQNSWNDGLRGDPVTPRSEKLIIFVSQR